MFSLIKKYSTWLHGQWPSGMVEKLPMVNNDGTTNISGVYIVGDLTGIPLLKFSADSGARAVAHLSVSERFLHHKKSASAAYDLIIIGGGVSGYVAAMDAKKRGLNFLLLEASEAFSTIKNFPNKKPIFTYPYEMTPKGEIKFNDNGDTKEKLLDNLEKKSELLDIKPLIKKVSHIKRNGKEVNVFVDTGEILLACCVIVAIGKSGNYRRLGIEGENNPKVVNRLHDSVIYATKKTVIVGGGDSALESTIAIANSQSNLLDNHEKTPFQHNSSVTLVHREEEFDLAKPENRATLLSLEAQNKVKILRSSVIKSISDKTVSIQDKEGDLLELENDAVLTLIGREAPLEFFRRSDIDIKGESKPLGWLFFVIFLIAVIALYDWKNHGFLNNIWGATRFPDQMPSFLAGLGAWWELQVNDRSTLIGTIATSMKSRSFYYTIVYTSCIGIFGWIRIQYRNTTYVTVQTSCLFFIQFIPLFLLPEIILPWLGYSGFFDAGIARNIADSLFPSYISVEALAAHQWPEWGHPRAYWHAYGFILAWPLNVYNVFTTTPIMGWLIISFIQTFILIPVLIYKFGKGAYCGWICSCGALAETLGDKQRHKMPHGPVWNKLNLVGQVLLMVALVLLIVRILGWIFPESWMHQSFNLLLKGENSDFQLVNPLSWKWTVDVLLGGILGVGLYFKYSGRVWCRFACPLAALMNIYTRFSRFRIFSKKDKCISCNICTSVCHQGIDVMGFASKGIPMEDPQCVRCSACVQSCPTNVLSFGEIDTANGQPIRFDKLSAIPISSK